MKKVIVNADDFGLTRGVNEGIILAHQKGILTSTTLLANGPAFDHAVDLSRENSRLGIGLHLNIVRGKPLSPPEKISSLLTAQGNFMANMRVLLRKMILRKIHSHEIECELRAQIEKVLAAGIAISHLDSEKHAHTIPRVFPIVLKLAGEYGICKVRYINETCFSFPPGQSLKSWLISFWCHSMKKSILEKEMVITDQFYGICKSGRMTAREFKRILRQIGEGVSEIMVHPGFTTPELAAMEENWGSYYINRLREDELQALLDGDLKNIIRERGIQLINFHEL